jgi:diphthine-ammonia ligase
MGKTEKKRIAVCWSGGKDSCLALYRLLEENQEVVCLVSMVSEKDARNHAHGIPLNILQMQADAIGLPIVMVDSAGDYELSLKKSLQLLKEQYRVDAIAFGSLYAEEDRLWNEGIAKQAGLDPLFPVWISPSQTSELLQEFISLGFTAVICRASAKHFNQTWAGRMLNEDFFAEVQKKDICAMGEFGEYHTFVLDGPIFSKRVEIVQAETVLNAGLWSVDLQSCQLVKKAEPAAIIKPIS